MHRPLGGNAAALRYDPSTASDLWSVCKATKEAQSLVEPLARHALAPKKGLPVEKTMPQKALKQQFLDGDEIVQLRLPMSYTAEQVQTAIREQLTVSGVVWARYYGRRHLGSVSGVAMLVSIAGSALGPLPMGLARDLMGSYRPMLTASALLPLILSVVALWARRPTK